MATSLIEGIHRRLPSYEQARYPDVEKDVLGWVRSAARQAAGDQAATEGLDRDRMIGGVEFFGEVSLRDRATDFLSKVSGVVPEIAESVADLPGLLAKARNDLAHHLKSGASDPLEMRYLGWLLVANVTPWLLRCVLLLDVGIDPNDLHERLIGHQRFAFFRANTAQHVRELGWPTPAQPGQ